MVLLSHASQVQAIAILSCSWIVSQIIVCSVGTTPGPIVLCSPVDHNGLNDVAKHPSLKTNENLSYLTNEFLKLAHDVIESTGPDTPVRLYCAISSCPEV